MMICEESFFPPLSLSLKAGLSAGLSASEIEELLKLSQSQPIKDKLKSTTQQALDYGVSSIIVLSPLF